MADLRTLDLLARMQLGARRRGRRLRLRRIPQELRELIALAGLDAPLGLEPEGQPEEREERRGLEEERQLDDPSA